MFWPNMDVDIKEAIDRCQPCQEMQRSNTKEPLLPMEIPTRPWEIVGTDLFEIDGDEYLLVVDYYSKFPIVRKMKGRAVSSSKVISLLQQIFGVFSIPRRLISDNGPQYDSHEFKEFAQEWGFQHVTSSPHYPQANGFVERNVQTVKNIIKKCRKSKSNFQMALLCLRTTPISHKIPAPAKLVFNRDVLGNLPIKLQNSIENKEEIYDELVQRQRVQKDYYDRGAIEKAPLVPGQSVMVQNAQSGRWQSGVVKDKHEAPRSYIVQTQSGSVLRRNARHLRAAPGPEENNAAGTGETKVNETPTAEEPDEQVSRRSSRVVKAPKRYIEEV